MLQKRERILADAACAAFDFYAYLGVWILPDILPRERGHLLQIIKVDLQSMRDAFCEAGHYPKGQTVPENDRTLSSHKRALTLTFCTALAVTLRHREGGARTNRRQAEKVTPEAYASLAKYYDFLASSGRGHPYHGKNSMGILFHTHGLMSAAAKGVIKEKASLIEMPIQEFRRSKQGCAVPHLAAGTNVVFPIEMNGGVRKPK